MRGLLRLIVLGAGFWAGVGLAAQAQSVSSLPPGGGLPEQSRPVPPPASTQTYNPKPGGNAAWNEDHYRPYSDYQGDLTEHPYSAAPGPKPGAHSSGVEVPYRASSSDARRAAHPYTVPATGPRPN